MRIARISALIEIKGGSPPNSSDQRYSACVISATLNEKVQWKKAEKIDLSVFI